MDHQGGIVGLSEDRKLRRHWLDFMIVPSKFEVPSTPDGYIKRPRLDKKLKGAAKRQLTIIEGPPGSGKTTLVSGWKEEGDTSLAYISLEEADNHLLRFWLQLIAAIDQAIPGFDNDLTERFIECFLKMPSRALAELNSACTNLSVPLVLILDGYQHIEVDEIHQMLSDWIRSLPKQLHIVMITYIKCPLKLPKHLIYRFGWPELAFTAGEIKRFCQKNQKTNVAPELVLQLQQETEGWALGLRMLGTMRSSANYEQHKITLDPNQNALDRYTTVCGRMMDQVLTGLSDEAISFLQFTSIPERIDESLIKKLTGISNPDLMLSHLERKRLFFQRTTEGAKTWYRYHPLIAQKLRNQLQIEDFELWRSLELTTGCWLESNEFPMEAMEHYIRGSHYDEAGRLLEGLFNQFIHQEAWTLRRFFSKIPDEIIQERPKLYLSFLFFAAGEQEPRRTLEQLDVIEWKVASGQGVLTEAQRSYSMRVITVMRAYVCMFKKDVEGLGYHLNDYLDRGFSPDDEIFSYIDYHERSYSRLRSFPGVTGRLLDAEACFGPIMQRWGKIHSYNTAYYSIGYGELLYERNQLSESEVYASTARSIGEAMGKPALFIPAAILLSRIAFGRNQLKIAIQYLRDVRSLLNDEDTHEWALILDAYETKIQLQSSKGETEVGTWFLQRHTTFPEAGSKCNEFLYMLVRARARIRIGQETEARNLLRQIQKSAASHELLMEQLEAYSLLALLYHRQGKEGLAARTLGKALQLSARDGHLRIYIDEGPPLRNIASHYRQVRRTYKLEERQISVRYIDQILFAFEAQYAIPNTELTSRCNPLSEMEKRVLLGVSKRWTSKEIAPSLDISIGTVNTYIQRIFSKLNVKKRKDAVIQAYRSGWIDSEQ